MAKRVMLIFMDLPAERVLPILISVDNYLLIFLSKSYRHDQRTLEKKDNFINIPPYDHA
jgi:hypothetical protein